MYSLCMYILILLRKYICVYVPVLEFVCIYVICYIRCVSQFMIFVSESKVVKMCLLVQNSPPDVTTVTIVPIVVRYILIIHHSCNSALLHICSRFRKEKAYF